MPHSLALDTEVIRPTHWLKGAVIGGTAVALLGAALGYALCSDPDSGGGHRGCLLPAAKGLAVGFGLGFSVGAILGGQFPEHSP